MRRIMWCILFRGTRLVSVARDFQLTPQCSLMDVEDSCHGDFRLIRKQRACFLQLLSIQNGGAARLPASPARRCEPGPCSLADQGAFKFCESGDQVKREPPR
ncbi:hypothetical protein WT73_10935 [Burkholderia stagnalis]|nr:hypothetical protein WT11_20025 [Burkholderia stagnalis]KVX60566.1 hypothetical protein WT33_18210 [Burkholderia stagnalis]KWI72990.1 hypothetical protein WT73_10935 [Burkholderia stagnalis]